jgi:signal transduction histidine kinase
MGKLSPIRAGGAVRGDDLCRLVQDLTTTWIGDADFQSSLEVVCSYGLRTVDAEAVSAQLLEGDRLRVAAQASQGSRPASWEAPAPVELPESHPVARAALFGTTEWSGPDDQAAEAVLAVPILSDRRVQGVLIFQRCGVAFNAEERRRAEALADQAGFAFRMLRRARELEMVYEVTRAINSSLNLDEVIEFIYQGISRILDADNLYIAFYDQDAGQIHFALEMEHRERKPRRSRPAGTGLSEHLLRTKRPLLIPCDFEAYCQRNSLGFSGTPAKCWMGAPMVFRDRAVGVIAVQSYDDEYLYDGDHLSVLENLAGQAAAAIENAGLYQQLKTSYENVQAAQQRLLQSEKLAAVGQLISGIAHELNNPLTGVVGWTQLLLGQPTLPGEVRGPLNTINEQAHRASRIVNNLLTFSRQHKPERMTVSVNQVLDDTLALRAYELRVNNIQVHRRYNDGLRLVWADPHQLQQVLLNLIINAEQAMLGVPRPGNLYLKTEPASDGALISVSDDGPGMSPALLKKIFDPFFTTKPVGQGTGLGLSISYGIIQEHGGRIWASSTEGQGATFFISLPWAAYVTNAAPAAAPEAPAPARRRILVVDDEDSVRDLLAAVLGEEFALETAATGEEGLTCATRASFDLVITDLKMPGLHGSVFFEQLQALLGARLPRFIFMTGDVLNNENQRLVERTGALFLHKPFDIYEAKELIRQALA